MSGSPTHGKVPKAGRPWHDPEVGCDCFKQPVRRVDAPAPPPGPKLDTGPRPPATIAGVLSGVSNPTALARTLRALADAGEQRRAAYVETRRS